MKRIQKRRPVARRVVTTVSVAAVAVVGALGVAPAARAQAGGAGGDCAAAKVVVRGVPGGAAAVRAAVAGVGGSVRVELPILDGVAASVPSCRQGELAAAAGVAAVSPDSSGKVLAVNSSLGYDTAADQGSMDQITSLIGARSAWSKYGTGKGVDVALIDTGVTPTTGMKLGANLVNGPDLSFDSQVSGKGYVDGLGHGTHLAGIIAGRDGDGSAASAATAGSFSGVAPGARVVNIKVGSGDGTADVSQVIAAVSWVAQHAKDYGLNIRVLNLSYGNGANQYPTADPLGFACEMAWRKAGVLVVAAAGNDGSSRTDLANPAINPDVLAVGAEDPNGTATLADDTIPAFATRGNAQRHVDVVAPATHVISLRSSGGKVDTLYPSSRVGTRFTRGSGTSQAAAVVSGAAAVIFGAKPTLTNDQVKWLLMNKATPLAKATTLTQGNGLVNIPNAIGAAGSVPSASTLRANLLNIDGGGWGSLDGSRGSARVSLDGVTLSGEKDISGKDWDAGSFRTALLNGTAWTSDGSYLGMAMTGSGWNTAGNTWSSRTWIGNSWTSRTWISENWASRTWIDSSWTGSGWMGGPWANASWS